VETGIGDGLATAVLNALPDATAVVGSTGSIVAINRAWRMFALDNGGRQDVVGVGVNYLDVCERSAGTGCEDANLAALGLRAVLAGETVESELEYPCPSPTVDRWFLLRVTPLSGPTSGAVVSHVNITRRKRVEEALAREAVRDPLTGLANRTLFNGQLASALTPRPGRSDIADVGVLYIDLDRFKHVNDTFGHDAGDEVLLEAAHRLRKGARDQDTVARLGGDEFAVVVPRVTANDLAALVTRWTRTLDEPYLIHGRSLQVRASIGAHLTSAGESVADALRQADEAMYAVKSTRSSAGSNRKG
jgi:diguanylate cyclase (GGDEF)-like protein